MAHIPAHVFKILSVYLFGFAGVLLIPLLLSSYFCFFDDATCHPGGHAADAFLWTFLICLFLSIAFSYFGKNSSGHLFKKDAIVVVVMIWALSPAIAGLPFLFSGTLKNPLQAYFEAASGLTTTGASILEAKVYNDEGKEIPIKKVIKGKLDTTYEYYGTVTPIRDPLTQKITHEGLAAVSKSLLFWRSFMQWLGGLGIVVLFVAILPSLGMSGKFLFQSEATGPLKNAMSPRIGRTAFQLWSIYVGLTILQLIMMMLVDVNMGWFDAVTTTFSTLSGGGFATHNSGIDYYRSAQVDWVIILFMTLGGVNFAVYYHALRGNFFKIYQPELILYLSILIISCCFGSWLLIGTEKVLLGTHPEGTFSISEGIRYASFQIVSSQTTVGFANANYDLWPYALQMLMLVLMFIGGMSGSTASGTKVIRLYILYHVIRNKLTSLFRSSTVRRLQLGGVEIDIDAINTTLCYLLVVVVIALLSTFSFIMDGIDPSTAVGLAACMMNNIGMAFGMAGPMHTFAFLSDFGLVLSSLLMVMGRLEFLVVLAVLVPSFWKKSA